MFKFEEIKKSLIAAVWFMFFTFPIMVIKVNTVEDVIEWRWINLIAIGVGVFFLSFLWRYLLERQKLGRKKKEKSVSGQEDKRKFALNRELFQQKNVKLPSISALVILVAAFPFIVSMYQTNIMITALMYVMLGLGLNIVVGLGGLLHLGYVAFYAVGAYSYALLNYHFGLNFWICLPIGAGLSTLFGILLGIPVLRLRGDYLAIVTLAFGEITRLVLENWNDFSFGPSGIANIPRPGFFGIDMSLQQVTNYIYFLMIGLTVLTIFVVNRLENSRIGRAWVALREDEVACQAMGINTTRTKLTSFALGALWAGLAGVMFAAKTTFINPASFTVWESILVLCIVVIGGMGSSIGVLVGAVIIILLPEYLRAFSEYRLLLFGLILVLMMVFRPGGIIISKRRVYKFEEKQKETA